MSAHTPGPWIASGNCVLPSDYCGTFECCGIAVCSHGTEAEIAEANARLIAAAPEMFAALKGLARAADDNGKVFKVRVESDSAVATRIRNVLAKIEAHD